MKPLSLIAIDLNLRECTARVRQEAEEMSTLASLPS